MNFSERLERILKLDAFINDLQASKSVITWFDSFEKDRDKTVLYVNSNTREVKLVSWMESHHNGNSYDQRERVLEQSEAMKELEKLELYLQKKAEEKALRNIRRKREEHDAVASKSQIANILGEKC